MQNWNEDLNRRAIGIVRRSSVGQEANTSADTQEREIRDYASKHGLELVQLKSITESAYKTDQRKKYKLIMNFAQTHGVKHILFYVGSREARNLTDNEQNESLIKADKITVHHVSEGKVYWKGSPDSDFLCRDISAAVNKANSRENGTKMKAAYRTKAGNGWWPYRHTPLGYVHYKERKENGAPIKGTARLIADPNGKKVQLVQREFEMRSVGLSYETIRAKNMEEGYVPQSMLMKYSKRGVEDRLKNPIYWGYFYLSGEKTRYEGKHDLIIPKNTLKKVEQVNGGRTYKRKSLDSTIGVFRGWLKCGHPDCERAITFEHRKKKLKTTNEIVEYKFYRCSNSRRVHLKTAYIRESDVWTQLEPSIQAFSINEDFAKDIASALNQSHIKQQAAIKKQMEGFRNECLGLENREDALYQDLKLGILEETAFLRLQNRLRAERRHFELEIERLTLAINDEGMISVQKVFELAINAKSLWKGMEPLHRLEYLKKIMFEPKLEGLTIRYQLEKPFARLASWQENCEWRRERDLNPRTGYPVAGFQNRCIQPLCHLSALRVVLFERTTQIFMLVENRSVLWRAVKPYFSTKWISCQFACSSPAFGLK